MCPMIVKGPSNEGLVRGKPKARGAHRQEEPWAPRGQRQKPVMANMCSRGTTRAGTAQTVGEHGGSHK